MKKKVTLDRDKNDFLLWMVNDLGLSEKTSKDYFSRCKRLDRGIPYELCEYLSTQIGFIKLCDLIKLYAKTMPATKDGRYAIRIDFMTSVKKYGAFKYPNMKKFYKRKKFT